MYHPQTVNKDRLNQLLDLYEDKTKAEYLRKGFNNGFELHYTWSRSFRECRNLKSTEEHPELFKKK